MRSIFDLPLFVFLPQQLGQRGFVHHLKRCGLKALGVIRFVMRKSQ